MDSPRHCVMVHEWFVPKKGDREVLVMDGDCHVMAYQYDIGRCGKFLLTADEMCQYAGVTFNEGDEK